MILIFITQESLGVRIQDSGGKKEEGTGVEGENFLFAAAQRTLQRFSN